MPPPLYSPGLCTMCKKVSMDRCSSCHSVYYCSKEHQKEDWPKHKLACRTYEIKSSLELGTYLVAARTIKVNDVIVSELPTVVGQDPRGEFFASCIGCSREIETLESTSCCPNCRWPACRRDCPALTDPARHLNECHILEIFSFLPSDLMPWKALILPLRVLLVQSRQPEKWKALEELARRAKIVQDGSGSKKFKDDVLMGLLRKTLMGMSMTCPYLIPDGSDETLKLIYPLLDIYGIRLAKPAGANLLAMYPVASYLQHNCLPNTINCFEGFPPTAEGNWKGRITVRAIREIPKGEILTVIHVNGMWSTKERQEELVDSRGFRCKCPRCMDPFELGLHTGTLKCANCPGWVIPTDLSKVESSMWKCIGTCGRLVKGRQVNELSAMFWKCGLNTTNPKGLPRFATSTPPSQDQVEKMLKKGHEFLHPKHQICLSAKVLLVASFSNELTPELIKRFSDAELQRKADLCKDVVKAIDEIGYSHNRLAMYASEGLLQATRAEVEIMKRRFKHKLWTPRETTEVLAQCKAQLRQILTVLRAETNDALDDSSLSMAAFDDRALTIWAKANKLKLPE